MFVEFFCVICIIAFIFLLVKEKDLMYVFGFLVGLLAALWIEPRGVAEHVWTYQNISPPFNFPLLGVPISLYLIYATGTAFFLFFTKFLVEFRKKNKDKYDNLFGNVLIAAGIIFLMLNVVFPIHFYIGLIFITVGLYSIVKSPVMFYVGALGLLIDMAMEMLVIAEKQMTYNFLIWDAGIGFFFGASIFAGIIILMRKEFQIKNR
jgi:hypothetical protein